MFRDWTQARLAVVAACTGGLDAAPPDDLVEDAAGAFVTLCTTGEPEVARRLLLEFGAYIASVFQPGAG